MTRHPLLDPAFHVGLHNFDVVRAHARSRLHLPQSRQFYRDFGQRIDRLEAGIAELGEVGGREAHRRMIGLVQLVGRAHTHGRVRT